MKSVSATRTTWHGGGKPGSRGLPVSGPGGGDPGAAQAARAEPLRGPRPAQPVLDPWAARRGPPDAPRTVERRDLGHGLADARGQLLLPMGIEQRTAQLKAPAPAPGFRPRP